MFTIFVLIIVIISASFHEFMHGWTAYKLGDDTAKNAGRLTMNPIVHIDPIGSILVPLLFIMSGVPFIIAAARPVPVNPYNLSDRRYGEMKVALSGPAGNLVLAAIFGLTARFLPLSGMVKNGLLLGFFSGDSEIIMELIQGSLMSSIFVMSIAFCFINLVLMVFNLVPVPPLDGSKVLMPFLSADWQVRMHRIEPYGFFLIILLFMIGFFNFIYPLISFLFLLLVGS